MFARFAVGTRFAYSNFGYIVLGRVIEKISGLSYGDYVRQILWTVGVHRLKLAHTRREEADLSEVTPPYDSPCDVTVPLKGLVNNY